MPIDAVVHAINSLDLKQISLENVEILQKMVPTEQEVKAYKEYIADRKDVNLLTDEDKFIMQLSKVERISSKLAIMNYMGNFFDSLHLITPVSSWWTCFCTRCGIRKIISQHPVININSRFLSYF